MQEYGYTWNEMFPLTQERAIELFDHDLPVYLLHTDGSETTVSEMCIRDRVLTLF